MTVTAALLHSLHVQYPEDTRRNCCYRNTRSTVLLPNVVMEQRLPNSDCQVSTETVRFSGGMSARARQVGERDGKTAQ